jgi:CheY-specific phosphatase CheX
MKTHSAIEIDNALQQTTIDSFSEMAFVDVGPAEPGDIRVSHLLHISFSGPDDGELVLHMPHECKQRIVENIYGEDWSGLNPTEIDDCLLELLNVIAGNFVQAMFGESATCDISLPELLFDESGLHGKEFEDCYLDAEGDLMKISYRVKNSEQQSTGGVS